MAKDPAFLFYSNDFLSGTFTMSDEQVGKYVRLLCLQHQKYELTEKDMLNICKTYDEDIYCKFEVINGKYFNIRLRNEAERRKAYSQSRRENRENSKKGLELKKEQKNGKSVSLSYDKHMETETETETKDVNNKRGKKKFLCLFENSEYYDYDKFRIKFLSNDNYKQYDVKYYYEAVKNWSASKGEMKKDWIATARNFALTDKTPRLSKNGNLETIKLPD